MVRGNNISKCKGPEVGFYCGRLKDKVARPEQRKGKCLKISLGVQAEGVHTGSYKPQSKLEKGYRL